MEIKEIYTSSGGEEITVYTGNIQAKELELGDELNWRIGSKRAAYHVIGRVAVIEDDNQSVYLDMTIEGYMHPTNIGRHVLKNLDINGPRARFGAKPFGMGEEFKKKVNEQVGPLDADLEQALRDIAKRRNVDGSPWLVRKS
ncbi:MAG TPA: hypothetical protein VF996_01645 [Candidatus Saccharimonadales bacterium]|jgi:hypothetical protein